MNKELRQLVYDKYEGRCAYCGQSVTRNKFQVDHIISMKLFSMSDVNFNVNDIQNLNPACQKCNNFKQVEDLETFRKNLSLQVERARRDSGCFRRAEQYDLIKETGKSVIFYFEKVG